MDRDSISFSSPAPAGGVSPVASPATAAGGERPVASPAAGGADATDGLRRAIKHLWGAERRLRGRDHARDGELSYAQMRAIAALGREREMTAGQLARSADVNPASVTAMLDQLEAAGMVARQRSAEDRRVCRVSLTDEGWTLLRRKLDVWEALWQEHMAPFTAAELETTTRVLDRVATLLDGLPGGDAERGAPESTARERDAPESTARERDAPELTAR